MTLGFAVAKLANVSVEARIVHYVLSTSALDRSNDTIAQDGWRLENYLKNPVLLVGHDRSGLPVGRGLNVGVTAGRLEGVYQFATAEQHPYAETVFRLVTGGFMPGCSVGFLPLKYVFNDETRGIDFLEQELFELSCVTVPCNPEALGRVKAAGIDVSPISRLIELEHATKALDPFAELRATLAQKAAPAATHLGRFEARSKALALKARHAGV